MNDTEQDRRFREQLERVSPSTRNLIQAIARDLSPNADVTLDFGIASARHLESLAAGIRSGKIMPLDLDGARGDGAKLTALVTPETGNPFGNVQFYTSEDALAGRPKPEQLLAVEHEEARWEEFLDRAADRYRSVEHDLDR